MLSLIWNYLAFSLLSVTVISAPSHERFSALSVDSLLGKRDDDFDPNDLSFITKLAAVGDSYSAGIGAGSRLGGLDGIVKIPALHLGDSVFNLDQVCQLLILIH